MKPDRLTDRQSQCDFDFDLTLTLTLDSVEFRGPAGQDRRLEAEELNRGIQASELLSAG
jgi:hypothetical protein